MSDCIYPEGDGDFRILDNHDYNERGYCRYCGETAPNFLVITGLTDEQRGAVIRIVEQLGGMVENE